MGTISLSQISAEYMRLIGRLRRPCIFFWFKCSFSLHCQEVVHDRSEEAAQTGVLDRESRMSWGRSSSDGPSSSSPDIGHLISGQEKNIFDNLIN